MNNLTTKIKMTSLELAELTGKRHADIMRDIRNMANRNKSISKFLIKDKYIDSQNQTRPLYLITKEGFEIFKTKIVFGFAANSIEKEYINIITNIFPNEKITLQKPFLEGKYKVDLYFDDLNIIVEIDENSHKYKKEQDAKREEEISNEIINKLHKEDIANGIIRDASICKNWFRIVHINENRFGEGLRKLMIAINEITSNSPTQYM